MYSPQTTSTRDLADAWPYGFQRVTDSDPLYEYLGIYATEIARLDAFIDTLYEQRFIETANSEELEKLAAEIGISRNVAEPDDAFRYRVQLRLIQAASNGTAEDIAQLLQVAFGPQATEIDISPQPSEPVLLFSVPESFITDIPVSQATFADILRDAMPAGTDIEILTEDVFTFVSDDDTPPEYAAGFDEGVWS